MSLRELLATHSSAELTEWEAFNRLEPFGDEWRQAATIAAFVAAGHGVEIDPNEIMPIPREPEREQTAEEMIAIFKAMAAKQKL
jgi:hypothetical protein